MAEDPYAGIAEPAQSAPAADPYAEIATPVAAAASTDTTPKETPGYFKEIMGGLGRAVSSVAGIPRQLMTPHETFGATREDEVKMGPVGRLIYNIPADTEQSMETSEAARKTAEQQGEGYAGQALAYGENSMLGSVVKKAEEAGPGYFKAEPATAGAVAEGGTTFGVAPKVAEGVLSKVGELRKSAADTMKGGGVQASARKFTNVESALKDEVKNVSEKQGVAEAKHAEATDTVKERAGLAKKVDEHSVKLRDQIGKVEESVHNAANKKFDAVREKIGNPETDPKPLIESVKNVETNILQGIPENIKEFRSILGHGEEAPEGLGKAFEEVTGEKPLGAEPMTWDKLQSLKSRIDARLRKGGGLNGDLKRGLYSVQNTIVDTMGDLAKGKGADALWNDARNTWRQYKEDFHEPTGPSGSGSPVAASLDAKDPKNIRQPFVAKQATTGNRGIDILRKYPQHGGTEAAATAEELMGHHENLRRMPDKAAPKPLATPTVDATQVARDAIAKSARNWGSFNARDIGILGSSVLAGTITHLLGGKGFELPVAAMSYEGAKYTASRVMNNPKVIDWLSKTPPEEAAVLAKIPGADKVRIIDGLTQQVISAGKPVKLSPAATKLLGTRNVARIMAATGGVSSTRVQNRKDALDLLNTQPTQ